MSTAFYYNFKIIFRDKKTAKGKPSPTETELRENPSLGEKVINRLLTGRKRKIGKIAKRGKNGKLKKAKKQA